MALRDYLNGAHLVDLYHSALKSDDIIGLLGRLKMDVIYDFDRLNEGTPDRYSASSPTDGFEIQFDEHQILDTIWCYIRPRGRFAAIDATTIGVAVPASHVEARRHAIESEKRFTESKPEAGSYSWLRIERESLWVHLSSRAAPCRW
jgi:hypothetical protein